MNFAQIAAILDDLPQTFLRSGAPFTQLADARTSELTLYGQAADGISNQENFPLAQGGWLDLWGNLFDVPRLPYEADAHYLNRIQFEVTGGNGTYLGIQLWILVVFGIVAAVQENLIVTEDDSGGYVTTGLGYTITFPSTVTLAQIAQVLVSIARVRPAGVPFAVFQQGATGTYVQTINFLDAPRVTGAFLSAGGAPVSSSLVPATTNNATPDIPDLYLIDPTLNPGI